MFKMSAYLTNLKIFIKAWWLMPVVPALGRLRITEPRSSRPVWGDQISISQSINQSINCISLLLAVLFTVAKRLKQASCSSSDEETTCDICT